LEGNFKNMKKVIVEISFVENNYSAHVPLLPGCVSVGKTKDEVIANIKEALAFHLEGMREDGMEIPEEFRGEYELEGL
jgi:predicted RNase H-like HicB family nuclease